MKLHYCAPRLALAVLMLALSVLLAACGTKSAPGPEAAAPPAAKGGIVPDTGTGPAHTATGQNPEADSAGAGQADGGSAATDQASAAPSAKPRDTAASRVAARLGEGYSGPGAGNISECWLPLVQRLQADPKASDEVITYFCSLPAYSPKPMGVKVKELFTSAFLRKKRPDDGKPRQPPSRIYRNIVTEANIGKCGDYLELYKSTFDRVEEKYPVPREVLVALLFVETRLGTYVGKENAFWSLACMAAADSPEMVSGGIEGVPITEKHTSWLEARLADKSEWAYREMRSLLAFCTANKLDPHAMPGSVYGAIGICQFMPSNLEPYGDDGDGDGVVNLFSEPDAIFSAARYLSRHGWKQDMTIDAQRAVLKRYNNLTIYANTILALAESVRSGTPHQAPPSAPIRMAKGGAVSK